MNWRGSGRKRSWLYLPVGTWKVQLCREALKKESKKEVEEERTVM
jgi:hypothetical protein